MLTSWTPDSEVLLSTQQRGVHVRTNNLCTPSDLHLNSWTTRTVNMSNSFSISKSINKVIFPTIKFYCNFQPELKSHLLVLTSIHKTLEAGYELVKPDPRQWCWVSVLKNLSIWTVLKAACQTDQLMMQQSLKIYCLKLASYESIAACIKADDDSNFAV